MFPKEIKADREFLDGGRFAFNLRHTRWPRSSPLRSKRLGASRGLLATSIVSNNLLAKLARVTPVPIADIRKRRELEHGFS